ncbi:hypothetical protein KC347_g105 [Hortaea werneckii]|nr:hypothetical protein KC347_g105 [Hortaea werneckii]
MRPLAPRIAFIESMACDDFASHTLQGHSTLKKPSGGHKRNKHHKERPLVPWQIDFSVIFGNDACFSKSVGEVDDRYFTSVGRMFGRFMRTSVKAVVQRPQWLSKPTSAVSCMCPPKPSDRFSLFFVQGLHEGHALVACAAARVVLPLAGPPATVLGRKQIIAPLAVDVRHDSSHVVIAEEAMQDGRFVECGDNKATDIRNEGDEDGGRRVGRRTRAIRTVHAAASAGKGVEAEGGARATRGGGSGILGRGGGSDRVARRLERQADVDQRAKSLGGGMSKSGSLVMGGGAMADAGAEGGGTAAGLSVTPLKGGGW